MLPSLARKSRRGTIPPLSLLTFFLFRTEVGQLLSSRRDAHTDKAWNYLRPYPKAKPYLLFDEIFEGAGVYELVVLDGLPTKSISNSDKPPKSFRTQDTFTTHPSIPDAWKFLGRIDDRVNLVTGEKVLPSPYEHRIRQSKLVRDCLVFGTGQAYPGLLIFCSDATTDMSPDDILDSLWPIIQDANMHAESFGHVPRGMVQIMPASTTYPCTDKGTIIRAACYKEFATVIANVYQRFDSQGSSSQIALEIPQLQDYLLKLVQEHLGIDVMDIEADLFSMGMDSLQAITLRAQILRELELGGNSPGQNLMFVYPSVAKLAIYLYSLRTGASTERKNDENIMRNLLAKYSDFKPFKAENRIPEKEVVVCNAPSYSVYIRYTY